MIRAIRDRIDADTGALLTPSQAWLDKAQVATAKALVEGAAHQADDAVYGALEVRMVLEKLCEQKCAYCESKIGINADWDVEHYRPKGRVSENATHPGYYWLAYDWDNLLPSCAFCNQRRFDRASLTHAGGPAAGKLDQFPLENEPDRCMNHNGDLSLERPWLLNPCEDEPEDHLSFSPDGIAIDKTPRGQRTIEICHLNRKRLCEERLAKIAAVKQLVKILRAAQETANQKIQEMAEQALESARNTKSPFAGVARAVLGNPTLFV